MIWATYGDGEEAWSCSACINPKFSLFSDNYRSLEAVHTYILGQGWSKYVDIKGASSYVITLPLNVDFILSPQAWKDCAFKFTVASSETLPLFLSPIRFVATIDKSSLNTPECRSLEPIVFPIHVTLAER